jgi:hypothetical protein
MKLTEFDRITTAVLLSALREEGFSFDRGAFNKNLPNGVRQVIIVDFDVRSKNTFRVIVGFNHDAVAGPAAPVDAGVYGVRYLDRIGLSTKPTNFPCFKSDAAKQSLELVHDLIRKVVLPWFGDHQEIQSVVETMEPYYAFVKGKILLSDKRFSAARQYFSDHLRQLEQKTPTSAVLAGIAETKDIMESIPQ